MSANSSSGGGDNRAQTIVNRMLQERRDRLARWTVVFTAVVAIAAVVSAAATIVYTRWTAHSVRELQRANEIAIASQRAYVSIEGIKSSYDAATTGTDKELWLLEALLVNKGQLSAEKVDSWIYWDEQEEASLDPVTTNARNQSLSPYGGTRTVQRPIARAEAEAIVQRSRLFVHAVVLYTDASGRRYYSTQTIECEYKRGEYLNWIPGPGSSGYVDESAPSD